MGVFLINMVMTALLSQEGADFRIKSGGTFHSLLYSSSFLFPRHFERGRFETIY